MVVKRPEGLLWQLTHPVINCLPSKYLFRLKHLRDRSHIALQGGILGRRHQRDSSIGQSFHELNYFVRYLLAIMLEGLSNVFYTISKVLDFLHDIDLRRLVVSRYSQAPAEEQFQCLAFLPHGLPLLT